MANLNLTVTTGNPTAAANPTAIGESDGALTRAHTLHFRAEETLFGHPLEGAYSFRLTLVPDGSGYIAPPVRNQGTLTMTPEILMDWFRTQPLSDGLEEKLTLALEGSGQYLTELQSLCLLKILTGYIDTFYMESE